MGLLDRVFRRDRLVQMSRSLRREASAFDIERISQQLPRASAPPNQASFRRVRASPAGHVCDWMHWSLWQDKQTGQVWVHASGGIADVRMWFGPGDFSVAEHLGAKKPR